MTWLARLFSEGGFSPHALCLAWDDQVLTWAIIGHAMIALAYAAIPAQLVLMVWKLGHGWRLVISSRSWVLALFAGFIVSCGIGHALMLLDYFRAFYRIEALWHVWTGLVSLLTAVMLPFMMVMERSGRHSAANVAQSYNGLVVAFRKLAEGRMDQAQARRIADALKQVAVPDGP